MAESDGTGEATPYWIGRHSGGVYWGEGGFFRIRRGVDALLIESYCSWGTIALPDDMLQAKVCTD
jgi:hypothetical protein